MKPHGRYVKPMKPNNSQEQIKGTLHVFLSNHRFHRFHTPAMRFHSGFIEVSPVSHACAWKIQSADLTTRTHRELANKLLMMLVQITRKAMFCEGGVGCGKLVEIC